ncbi:hypothetical protein SCLCIDRAFT_1208027 [Scleroderma citrinum Foug A]|uniref:Uncharacterized protein n=1 Tax=Scleroderma citrinum Foug A TaxID=1036808 RepID=A0A0C3AX60_9AGAM|nr:hypothetical protein SCLCIDRAFT_1208027 [Scleroderma citrinum Foug A]
MTSVWISVQCERGRDSTNIFAKTTSAHTDLRIAYCETRVPSFSESVPKRIPTIEP